MAHLKVGDRMQNTNKGTTNAGKFGVVIQVNPEETRRNDIGERCIYEVRYDDGSRGAGDLTHYVFVPPTPVNFILQYDLDVDPFETFETMKEVQARIKELAKRPDLNRDTVKVYEVSKTYDVRLETTLIFGVRGKLTEKVAVKKAAKKTTKKR